MPYHNFKNIGELVKNPIVIGEIVKLYYEDDTCDVKILTHVQFSTNKEPLSPKNELLTKVPIFYHCADNVEERDNGALYGSAGAFMEGDLVYVIYPLKVIAHVEEKRPCCLIPLFCHYSNTEYPSYYYYNPSTKEIVNLKVPPENISCKTEQINLIEGYTELPALTPVYNRTIQFQQIASFIPTLLGYWYSIPLCQWNMEMEYLFLNEYIYEVTPKRKVSIYKRNITSTPYPCVHECGVYIRYARYETIERDIYEEEEKTWTYTFDDIFTYTKSIKTIDSSNYYHNSTPAWGCYTLDPPNITCIRYYTNEIITTNSYGNLYTVRDRDYNARVSTQCSGVVTDNNIKSRQITGSCELTEEILEDQNPIFEICKYKYTDYFIYVVNLYIVKNNTMIGCVYIYDKNYTPKEGDIIIDNFRYVGLYQQIREE